jgi:exopolysaccharide production protein ExoZ
VVGIQYLRALAASMVVVHHAWMLAHDTLPQGVFGSRGVDLFFVISGFVMALSTARLDASSPWFAQAARFWQRRLVRIVPLYWLALLWMSKGLIVHGDADAGLLKDFFFWPRFHPAHPAEIWPWLVPGWTLAYEMLFYLLFGLAMAAGRRRHAVVAAVIGSLVLVGTWSDPASAQARFVTHNVMLEFVFGVGLWRLLQHPALAQVPRSVAACVAAAGFALMALDSGYLPRGLADGVPAALVVGGVVIAARGTQWRGLSALGDASYSTYLCQVFVFGWFERALAARPAATDTVGGALLVVVLALLACTAVGWAVHRVIERPLLRWLDPRQRAARRARPALATS